MSDPRLLNLHDFGRHAVLPDDVVRIDRPREFSNPFRISATFTREQSIAAYREHLKVKLWDPLYLEPLRGKRLACWCAPLPCHGDVILEHLDATEKPAR